MRAFLKKIAHPFLKLGLKIFYFKPRRYTYDRIEVKVHPDVFPPHLTLSTKMLLDFIKPLDLKGKTFLELGCGSGIISLYAAQKEAFVTASDINQIALEYLKKAANKNHLTLEIIHSDLFNALNQKKFEYIIINPPYYPKKPKNIKEKAWFCGEDFEYFEKLFKQLPDQISENTNTYMILSEDCKIMKIKNIALRFNLIFSLQLEKKIVGEKNYIFKIAHHEA